MRRFPRTTTLVCLALFTQVACSSRESVGEERAHAIRSAGATFSKAVAESPSGPAAFPNPLPEPVPLWNGNEKVAGATLRTINHGSTDGHKWAVGLSLGTAQDAAFFPCDGAATEEFIMQVSSIAESAKLPNSFNGTAPRVQRRGVSSEGFDGSEALPEYLGCSLWIGKYADETTAKNAATKLKSALDKAPPSTFPGQKASAAVVFIPDAGDSVPLSYVDADEEAAIRTTGPWSIRVLTLDPGEFRGNLAAAHTWLSWPDKASSSRAPLTTLAKGAIAGINGGYFVMNSQSGDIGVEGEPAGLFIDRGKVLSEASGRVTMNLFNNRSAPRSTVVEFQELTTRMSVEKNGTSYDVNGINRIPGVVRNCGIPAGTPPQHDLTCKVQDELVVLTPEYQYLNAPPSGNGAEAVVENLTTTKEANGVAGEPQGKTVQVIMGTVKQVRPRTGAKAKDAMIIQGIGTNAVSWLNGLQAGNEVRFKVEARNRTNGVEFGSTDYAVNGGPRLVVEGKQQIRPVADGLYNLPTANPYALWNWGLRRHPRTLAGVDSDGRILLVTVDGRQKDRIGLSLVEAAQVMVALGAVEAINLDGGGSTTMTAAAEQNKPAALVNSPSDKSVEGQRAIGDAILLVNKP